MADREHFILLYKNKSMTQKYSSLRDGGGGLETISSREPLEMITFI